MPAAFVDFLFDLKQALDKNPCKGGKALREVVDKYHNAMLEDAKAQARAVENATRYYGGGNDGNDFGLPRGSLKRTKEPDDDIPF